ncbi:PH domain-containing protein [Brevibacterium epidermidis]|uniref:PH domain-containing protein n=1 Tax=Brevibacterium epidermidis TaxID=1698 RepID=UPI00078287D8|nr:PH domain-containing protein [Brevibacterium epidermidis]
MSAPIILRQRSGPIITVIVWAFLAFLLGDALLRGAWDTVGRFGPALLLIGWVAFAVLWRPALVVGTDEVEVREILRTISVPFTRIRDIRLGSVVTIEASSPDGATRTIRPWNAPGMPRRKIDSGLTGGTRPESLDNHPAFELLRRWEHDQNDAPGREMRAGTSAGAEEVRTRWSFGVIGVTLVLVLLVAIELI